MGFSPVLSLSPFFVPTSLVYPRPFSLSSRAAPRAAAATEEEDDPELQAAIKLSLAEERAAHGRDDWFIGDGRTID